MSVPPFYSSLLLVFFPLAAGLMLAAAAFVWTQSRHRAAPWLSGVLVLAGSWLVLSSAELLTHDPELKFRWYQLRYLLTPFQPFLYLFAVAELVGARKITRPASLAFWLAFPVLSIPLVLTFREHELLRADLHLVSGLGFSWWAGRFGPAAIGVTAVIYAAGILGSLLLVRAAIRRGGVERREYLGLLATYAFTTTFDLSFRFGLGPMPGFNLVPFAQVPTFAILVWLLLRYRTFDVLTEMHALLVDRLHSLIFLADETGRILEANEAASVALGLSPRAVEGMSVGTLPLFRAPGGEVSLGEGPAQRWFRCVTVSLRDGHGRHRGTLWVFDEITLERAREEEARVSERLREERRHAQQLELVVRDIHDGVGGATATISLLAALARQEGSPAAKDEALRRIQAVAEEGSADVRSLLNALEGRATSWPELLVDFRSYAVALLEKNHLQLAFRVVGTPPEEVPPLYTRISLFRFLKEALANVVKHAVASRVEVALCFAEAGLRLEVKDDGRGLPPEAAQEPAQGVRTMRRRARELGGVLELRPAQPSGLELRLDLALPAAGSEAP